MDRDVLVAQLAEALWESRQRDEYVAWAEAGELWHVAFRQLAETAIDTLSAR